MVEYAVGGEGYGSQNQIVSLSKDILRTEIRLANTELELSLRKWIGDELAKKASLEEVKEIARQLALLQERSVKQDGPIIKLLTEYEGVVDKLTRGEFTPIQVERINDVVETNALRKINKGWTRKERLITTFGFVISICGLIASIYIAFHR